MFSNLTDKLIAVINKIGKRGVLTEEVVDSTIREIRVSLLEADVALPVVKAFSANLKEKLIGQKVLNSITPEQTVIKAVYDELVALLGEAGEVLARKRGKILMVGLQGTGKTTTSAKLAHLLQNKFNRKALLVSLDTYRPAAIEQLKILAANNSIDFFYEISPTDTPIDIANKAVKAHNKYDVVIYDTAGRTHIDEQMMNEVIELQKIVEPDELLLVIDSMMGQDAVNTAKTFQNAVPLTGLVLTRADGDARGGAILSAKYVTNCQVKFICNGEKINDIEQFYPERIASRILDQGDVMSLIEKAAEADIPDVMPAPGKFDLNSMEQYLKQLEKIGGLSGFMKFLPGVKKIKENLQKANVNDKTIARQIAVIRSMTKAERCDPKILNASRRRRIARGCGQEVSDVNRLVKQFEMAKVVFSKYNNPEFLKQLR